MNILLNIKWFFSLFLILCPFLLWSQDNSEDKTTESKSEYVTCDPSSKDAFIFDKTDFFEREPLCSLLQNQKVTVLDSTDGEYIMIIAFCKGKEIKGWVKKNILAKEPLQKNPKVTESGGVENDSYAAPASIGYGIPDTTGFRNQEIEDPWNDIDLSSAAFKIPISVPPKLNHRIIWPIVGTAAVGTSVIIFVNKDVDESQTPLIVNSDEALANCGESLTVDVLANDQGDGLEITSAQCSSAVVEVINNKLKVSDLTQNSNIITYFVLDDHGITSSGTLSIIVEFPPLNAFDDDFSLEENSSVDGNLLNNDIGQELTLISYSQPASGQVLVQANGDFSYQAALDFSGTVAFSYTIYDACDQSSEAIVTITVIENLCDFNVTFQTINASCGFADGIINSLVDPPGNYTFQWSNTSMEQDLIGVEAGIYEVEVTDMNLQCSLTFSADLEENQPAYISDVLVSPIICPNNGDISFQVSSPDGADLSIHVESASESYDLMVSSGEVSLNDYIVIEDGNYTINVSTANALGDCIESIEVQMITQVNLIVDINETINPSSTSANDGAIFGTILSTVPAPFELFVNGNPIILDDVIFDLEGLSEGSYALYVINSEGCISDILVVLLQADPEIGSRISLIASTSTFQLYSIPELPAFSIYENGNYRFQLEAKTGKKSFYPIIGLSFQPLLVDIANNLAVWEINCQWNKCFSFHQFQWNSRAGIFMNVTGVYADRLVGPLWNYGMLLISELQYKVFDDSMYFPFNTSLKAGGRIDMSPLYSQSELFIAIQFDWVKNKYIKEIDMLDQD